MTKNNGKPAEAAFVEHWEKVGHVQRFYDQADLRGRNGGQHVGDFPKPADYLVSSPHDDLHFAEVKSCHGKTSFPFGSIQPGQSAAAKLEAKRGAGAYIFYIFSYHHGSWFYMTCHQYVALLDAGKRSVSFEELRPWVK